MWEAPFTTPAVVVPEQQRVQCPAHTSDRQARLLRARVQYLRVSSQIMVRARKISVRRNVMQRLRPGELPVSRDALSVQRCDRLLDTAGRVLLDRLTLCARGCCLYTLCTSRFACGVLANDLALPRSALLLVSPLTLTVRVCALTLTVRVPPGLSPYATKSPSHLPASTLLQSGIESYCLTRSGASDVFATTMSALPTNCQSADVGLPIGHHLR